MEQEFPDRPEAARRAGEVLRRIGDDYDELNFRTNPIHATFSGRRGYDHLWPDLSPEAFRLWAREIGSLEKRLEAIPVGALSEQDRTTAALLRRELSGIARNARIYWHLSPVAPHFGIPDLLSRIFAAMPCGDARDYEAVLARLEGLPAFIDGVIGLLEEAIGEGWTPPAPLMDRILQGLDRQLETTAADSPVLGPFRRFPPALPEASRRALLARAVLAEERSFRPAWSKLRACIAGRYAPRARGTAGIEGIPGGTEIYRFLVGWNTTTTLEPAEIHAVGLAEVARIEAEMEAVAGEAGASGSAREYEARLNADPGQRFRDGDEILAWCRNIAKLVEPELPRLFGDIPWMLYGIRAIQEGDDLIEASCSSPPVLDRSRPGWVNLSIARPGEQVKYDKEAMVLHEGVPGHLLQNAYVRSADHLTDYRKLYRSPAYSEGWALYAESLGTELGLYRDPPARFGRLVLDRLRAARLVIDTGLHAKGWTRERAIAYLREHGGTRAEGEVDRSIALPAHVLSYKIGELEIRRLRDRARDRLGSRFDIRRFHAAVLRDGPLPLDLLGEAVDGALGDGWSTVDSRQSTATDGRTEAGRSPSRN